MFAHTALQTHAKHSLTCSGNDQQELVASGSKHLGNGAMSDCKFVIHPKAQGHTFTPACCLAINRLSL